MSSVKNTVSSRSKRLFSVGFAAALLTSLAPAVHAQDANSFTPNTILDAALQAMQQIDAQKAADLYPQTPQFVKTQVHANAFAKGITEERAKLSAITARQWVGIDRMLVTPPGQNQPTVPCANVRFIALHQNVLVGSERVSVCWDQTQWRAVGYTAVAQPAAAPAQKP